MLVALPLINWPLVADHQYNVFRYGGDLTQRPWEIVTGPLSSIPAYLDTGNFRPLGRMVEQGQDLLAFSLTGAFDLPVPVALRVVALLSVALLCMATVLWAETVSSRESILTRPPSLVALVTAVAVPVFLVATAISAVVLFAALYLASAALVLLVAATAARRRWFDSRHAGLPLVAAAVVVGAGLAAFNEIAYLAVPLALVTVAARGLLTLGMTPTDLVRTTATRLVLGAGAGFAAVFVPVRLVIAGRCADGGCYIASDLAISQAALPALGHRLLSSVPVNSWSATGTRPSEWLPGWNPALLAMLCLIVLLVVLTWRDIRAGSLPTPGGVAALGIAGAALLVGTSLSMALTGELQLRITEGEWPVGEAWRDQGLVAAGGALLVAAAVTGLVRLASRRHHRTARTAAVVAVGLLGIGAMITTGVNAAAAADQRPDEEAQLFDRISVALLHGAPADDEARCAMLREFNGHHPNHPSRQARLSIALESAARAWHDAPFCSEAALDLTEAGVDP